MDAYREKISRLIEAVQPPKANDLKNVSLAIGKNHAYLQQFLNTGTPRVLPEEVRYALAEYLGIDERELRPDVIMRESEARPREPSNVMRGPLPPAGERDLPVMGETVAGREGEFSLNGTVNEYLSRPAQLRSVVNGYAVYVVGDSMIPAAGNGQVAYVNPNKPPSINGLVVCELKDGRAFIKTLKRRKPGALVLHQYNPEKDIEVAADDVKHLHRVVLVGDPA